jgi:tetratricopeptide (TPR) repeat protein
MKHVIFLLFCLLSLHLSCKAQEHWDDSLNIELDSVQSMLTHKNYSGALKFSTKVMYEFQRHDIDIYHDEYVTVLRLVARCHYFLKNPQQSINYGTQALLMQEKGTGKLNPNYALILDDLANFYSEIGNYQKSIALDKEALLIKEKLKETEDHNYAKFNNSLGIWYFCLGNYNESIKYYTQALKITGKVDGLANFYYVSTLAVLANIYSKIGNLSESTKLYKELNQIKKSVGFQDKEDINSLITSSRGYYNIGNNNEAIKESGEALRIIKENNGTENILYAAVLSNHAIYNAALGNVNEAINMQKEALQITEKILGRLHPYYIKMLFFLAADYFKNKDYKNASYNFTEYNSLIKNYLLANFSTMTGSEREALWKEIEQNYSLIPNVVYSMHNNDMNKCCYDALLLSKGLLLNTEIEMNRLVAESGDKEVENEFKMLQANRAKLKQQYELSLSKRTINVDSLNFQCMTMEKRLAQISETIGSISNRLQLNWQDVQKALKPNDTAIEFSEVNDLGMKYYIALVINKSLECPKMIPLALDSAYESYADNMYSGNSSKKMYNLVWKRLEPYMHNGGNVYFSPSGIFYHTNIEVLCDSLGRMACEKYNLYRVSSTREICYEKKYERPKTASLYGNIDYFMETKDMAKVAKQHHTIDNHYLTTSVDYTYTENDRGALKPLEGTEKEVNDICEKLKKVNISAVVVKGKEGTEESFKALSGKHTSIIHLATHGFFFDNNTRSMLYIENLMINDDSPTTDTSMKRAGLAFAGANNAWSEKIIPNNVDDGLLFAEEIPTIDLRGCDLLVLSACETGLGDVTSDGVFGLQRGFKQAGVNTIVMSLWKVNDNATTFFMEQFYKNFTQGQTKQKAFLNAQKALRDSKEFNDPKDWAAFIMLDAI